MTPRRSIVRKTLSTGALATGVSPAGVASAATSSSGSSRSTTEPNGSPGAPANPATITPGPDDTLLTGTDLQKAEAAARAAVPGATLIRAETDSPGPAPYEVHLRKADGSEVTVELNSSFQAIKTITGFGPGPAAFGAGYGPAGSGAGSGGPPGDVRPGGTAAGSLSTFRSQPGEGPPLGSALQRRCPPIVLPMCRAS